MSNSGAADTSPTRSPDAGRRPGAHPRQPGHRRADGHPGTDGTAPRGGECPYPVLPSSLGLPLGHLGVMSGFEPSRRSRGNPHSPVWQRHDARTVPPRLADTDPCRAVSVTNLVTESSHRRVRNWLSKTVSLPDAVRPGHRPITEVAPTGASLAFARLDDHIRGFT